MKWVKSEKARVLGSTREYSGVLGSTREYSGVPAMPAMPAMCKEQTPQDTLLASADSLQPYSAWFLSKKLGRSEAD